MASSSPHNPAPLTLEYVRKPRLVSIGRHRKKLIFLAIGIAIAIFVYEQWVPLKHRAQWLYWSCQAAAFAMPGPIELIVDSDPAKAAKLLATNPDYVAGDSSGQIAVYSPAVYRQFRALDSRCDLTSDLLSPLNIDVIVFMGSVRRPDGKQRLVIIKGPITAAESIISPRGVLVMPPPGVLDSMPPPTTISWRVNRASWRFTGFSNYHPVELRGGIIDLNDPTHVIVEYIARGKDFPMPEVPTRAPRTSSGQPGPRVGQNIVVSGKVDLYLQNDDSLKLSLGEKKATGLDPVTGNAELVTRYLAVPEKIVADVRTLEQAR